MLFGNVYDASSCKQRQFLSTYLFELTTGGVAYVIRTLCVWIRNLDRWTNLRRAPGAYAHALDCRRCDRTLRRWDSVGCKGDAPERSCGITVPRNLTLLRLLQVFLSHQRIHGGGVPQTRWTHALRGIASDPNDGEKKSACQKCRNRQRTQPSKEISCRLGTRIDHRRGRR